MQLSDVKLDAKATVRTVSPEMRAAEAKLAAAQAELAEAERLEGLRSMPDAELSATVAALENQARYVAARVKTVRAETARRAGR